MRSERTSHICANLFHRTQCYTEARMAKGSKEVQRRTHASKF